jgi:hypothetical protein
MESLADQKAGAMRWMSRQKIRLNSQAEEVRVERAAIAQLLALQRQDVRSMMELLVD